MSESPSGFSASLNSSFRDSRAGPAHTQPSPLGEAPPPSAGAMLRQMREAAGVDAGLLASALKVSVQKIEALETDRLDQLPDLTFARGLASAICRAFDEDPAPVLERMPVSAPGLRVPRHTINQPFRQPGDGPAPMSTSLPKPVLILAALLLLGALALWLLPTLPIQLGVPEQEEGAVATDAGMVNEPVAPATEPVASEQAPAGLPAEAASDAALAAPAQAASEPASAAAQGQGGQSDLLVFTATGETWISVRDARDKQLLNRALNAGDVVKLSGDLPLSVTIGRKDAVTVTVRGEPFDHRSLSRTSVSRFQVQ